MHFPAPLSKIAKFVLLRKLWHPIGTIIEPPWYNLMFLQQHMVQTFNSCVCSLQLWVIRWWPSGPCKDILDLSENIFISYSIRHRYSREKRSLSVRLSTSSCGNGRKWLQSYFLLTSFSLFFQSHWHYEHHKMCRAWTTVVIWFLRSILRRKQSSWAEVHLYWPCPGLRS